MPSSRVNKSTVSRHPYPVRLLSFICISALCYIVSLPVSAQEQPVFDLGEIVVIGTPEKPADEIRQLPTASTIILRESFEKRFTAVPELLSESAGVEVRRYGGLGSFSTVSIRGSESDQVLVMIDGVALNPAFGGAIDLSTIPVSDIERIEIFRGNAPVKYSGSAIGGVINIVTRENEKKHKADAAASFGSFGTFSSRFSVRTPWDGHSLAVNFMRESSNGGFSYTDDNGTPSNPNDDERVKRENNDFTSDNLDLKFTSSAGRNRTFSFSGQSFMKNQGVPGLGNLQSKTARLKTARNIFLADFEDRGVSLKNITSRLQLSDVLYRTDFFDPEGIIYHERQDNRNTTRVHSFRSSFEWFPGRGHLVTVSSGYSRETYKPYDALKATQTGKSSSRKNLALAAEDRISLLDGRLLLIPSYRLDKITSRFAGDNPFDFSPLAPQQSSSEKLTAFYTGARLKVTSNLTVKANLGRYYRAPSFFELFGDRSTVIGNTALEPEKGRNRDFGVTLDLSETIGRPGIFEVSLFRNITDNAISLVRNSPATARPVNIGRAINRGVETSLSVDPTPRWNIASNFTFQNAKDDSLVPFYRGNYLPGRHVRMFDFKIENHTALWKVYYSLSRSGKKFLDSANLYPISKSDMHNLGVSYLFGKTTVTAEGKNLTDNQISDIMGFPLPGRSFFITVHRKF